MGPSPAVTATHRYDRRMSRSDPTLAESVCLALIAGGVEYGGAIAGLLAPGAELGRIWSLSKPLTYRAVDALVEEGLVRRSGTVPGRGRERTVLRTTRRGAAAAHRWVETPVEHLRDVRTELLLKFAILEREGRSPAALAQRQLDTFAQLFEVIGGWRADDLVSRWRAEHADAVERFLRSAAR